MASASAQTSAAAIRPAQSWPTTKGHDLSYRTFLNGMLSGNILIDTSQAATDTVDYVATDTWGNTSTSTRTLIVQAASSSSSI